MFTEDDALLDEDTFDINVIPLIDVLLVLLIFFMASSSFVAAGGIDVKLPSSHGQATPDQPKSVTITLTKAGELLLDNKPISFDTFRESLGNFARQEQKPLLIIRADEKAEHGSVVRILDEAKIRGLNEVAIATMLER